MSNPNVNDFFRGIGVGHYQKYEYNFYRIDFKNMAIILHDYYDDYRDMSVNYTRIDPVVAGIFVKAADTLVLNDGYYFKQAEIAIDLPVIKLQKVLDDIQQKLSDVFLEYPHAKAALSEQVIDKLYAENVDAYTYYRQFLEGKELLDIHKLKYFFEDKGTKTQDITSFLVNADAYIGGLAEELLVHKQGQSFIEAMQQELLYQKYKQYHTEHGTFEKEQALIQLFDNELKNAKNIWVHLDNGEKKQVEKHWSLEGSQLNAGRYYGNTYDLQFIVAIQYQKKTYKLPENKEVMPCR